MKTTLGPVIEWLYKATAGIRFKPDRKAVRAELEEHLEDTDIKSHEFVVFGIFGR